jgi:hypothetical protein
MKFAGCRTRCFAAVADGDKRHLRIDELAERAAEAMLARVIAGTHAACVVVVARAWESAMEARQRIAGASFGPKALRVIGQAFDAAWVEIAGNFGNDLPQIEAARLKLATTILSIATDDSSDVEVLKKAAIEQMAMGYRQRMK